MKRGHTRLTGAPVKEYLMAPQRQEPVVGFSVSVMMSDCFVKLLNVSGRQQWRRKLIYR